MSRRMRRSEADKTTRKRMAPDLKRELARCLHGGDGDSAVVGNGKDKDGGARQLRRQGASYCIVDRHVDPRERERERERRERERWIAGADEKKNESEWYAAMEVNGGGRRSIPASSPTSQQSTVRRVDECGPRPGRSRWDGKNWPQYTKGGGLDSLPPPSPSDFFCPEFPCEWRATKDPLGISRVHH
ncbi:hypothetical protein Scep_028631 [Stephania cephalantha]|uniref:Uncharacterized protein n=1 Tax=Stephania cephalantha TaxID=152367 RepID=A0AAP0HJS6_9MAGN